MTVIVGAVRDGRVCLGGDSACVDETVIQASTDPKVWRSGGVLVGGAGEFRTLDVARRVDHPAAPDETWIRYGFPAALAKLYREIDGERTKGGDILVGALGALWIVLDSLAVVRLGEYTAIGSGGDLALGAMHARPRATPRDRVIAGLAAAIAHCPTVCGPYAIVTL